MRTCSASLLVGLLALTGCDDIGFQEPMPEGLGDEDGGACTGTDCSVDDAGQPDTASEPDTAATGDDAATAPDASQPDTSTAPDVSTEPDSNSSGFDAAGCVASCGGKVCGPDGCGSTCGSCGPGERCGAGGTSCTPGSDGYAHASEAVHDLQPVIDLSGTYGAVFAGGHLLAGDSSGGSALPRETRLSSSGTVEIPAGATVRHALLWVSGVVFLKPASHGQGDYTSDDGGDLDSDEDIRNNGVTLHIDGSDFGPYDTASRKPLNPSAVGSETQLSPTVYDPSFGTLTGVKQTVWANRLDITGLFAGKSGSVQLTVDPPEKLDVNGNDMMSNGGNPAGSTEYNLCSGAASWSLVVVYEHASAPRTNIVLMDGAWARAWDYLFFHYGAWQRPVVRIDHAPIQPGARYVIYAASGTPAGADLPSYPTCSCGCGGQYTLRNISGPYGRNDFFSDEYQAPAACSGDPQLKDSTNGPWYLHSGGLMSPKAGNDWTLLQSGNTFTEFPNLFEGDQAPAADSTEPVTDEDSDDAAADTYAGHPWGGRGTVTYHATGNAVSVVEVEPAASAISQGETTSYLFFKGDQKDLWKPQQAMSIKYILFETPLP